MLTRFIQYIKQYFPTTTSKKHVVVCLIVCASIGVVFFGMSTQTAHAVGLEDVRDGFLRLLTEIALLLARLCMAMAIFFLRFFIQLGAYNGFLDAPIVRLGWVMLRDIANMFFVVALLVIAFATILGRESYEWKKAMVKLVLVAILVNFSLLICGIVLDAVHVFTVTFINAIAPVAAGNLITMFNFGDMESIIADSSAGGNSDIKLALFGGAAVALFFSAMAALTIGAYCIILLYRMVAIWSLLIFSPLAFVMSVLPATESYFEEWKSEFTKNILSAPIAVFFLWLAFATMGANSAVSHINDHSSRPIQDATGTSSTTTDSVINGIAGNTQTNSVSLNVASTWANMAGFLVAMAFLLKGVEQVQSLGVRGAGWLDSAQSFAKNVATIGTGVALGGWLLRKGAGLGKDATVGAAKYVGYRVPLVGGAALQEYGAAISSTFKRKGLAGVLTAGRVSGIGGAESKIKSSEKAKNWETKGLYGNRFGSKTAGWLAARVWEPAERAKKRSEDWNAAAERVAKVQEESYSTSASIAGQVKLDATVRLNEVEAKASAKGKEKVSGRKQHAILAQEAYAAAKLNGRTENQAKQAAKDAVLASLPEASDKKKMEELWNRDGGVEKFISLGKTILDEQKTQFTSTAEADQSEQTTRISSELRQAEIKDELLIKSGKKPIHVAAVRDKQQKELEDAMSGLNFRQITRQAASYVTDIQTAKAAGASVNPEIMRSSVATITAAMKRGSETGMGAINEVLSRLGYTDSELAIGADEIEKSQRMVLAALLGEKIDLNTANVATLETKLATELGGGDRAQAVLRQLDVGFKSMAKDGAVNMVGLLNDQTLDSNGNIEFKFNNTTDIANPTGHAQGSRKYFAEEQNFSTLTGVEDIIDRVVDGHGNKTYVVQSAMAQEQLKRTLNKFQPNTQPTSKFIASMKALELADSTNLERVLRTIPEKSAQAIIDKCGLAITL